MSAYAPIEVGVEAYIIRAGQLLLGKRKNTYGAGTWGMPGGRIEFMERAGDAIIRELKEETGLSIASRDISLLAVTDDPQAEHNQHHLHITFKVDIGHQEPKLLEPEACEEWRWFPLEHLQDRLFPPHQRILRTINSGEPYGQ